MLFKRYIQPYYDKDKSNTYIAHKVKLDRHTVSKIIVWAKTNPEELRRIS